VTPKKLSLFDLDGTLFDHQHSRRLGLGGLQRAYSQLASIPLGDLCAEYERQVNATYDRVLDGKVSLVDSRTERFRRLFRQFGVDLRPAALQDGVRLYRDVYESSRRAVPGSLLLLSYLKAYGDVGIVTNGLKAPQLEKVTVCGLDSLVDFVLTSEEVGAKKPERMIFVAALEKAGVGPESAAFVGDSWSSDILGACGASIRAVWLNRAKEPCPDPAIATELRSYEPLDSAAEAIRVEP
jgi:HAD superfamily hydrolase (TIGR01509 family)